MQTTTQKKTTPLDDLIERMLTHEYFLPSDDDISDMWNEQFTYPDYNDPLLKQILFKLAIAEKSIILKGTHTEEGYTIEWYVVYHTSPRDVKIIHQRRFRDYPSLSFEYEATKDEGKYISEGVGGRKISIGQIRSIIKNYPHEWV